jgi:Na+-driven multidrug efflux pump
VAYGRVLFGGAAAIWLANMCASILRGTGNMLAPGVVMTVLLTLSIPLSGALTLGWFGLPALAVRGPAAAFVTICVVAGIVMGGYVLSGRAGLRLRWSGLRLRADLAGDILRVGLFGCANSTLTIITVIVVTALVGRHGTAALAGYGLGSRLEILLVPLAFGVGAALVALVGANRGARQFARARRIAWTGGLAVFALCAVIGAAAVLAPDLWIGLFSRDAQAADVARQYLRIAGYGYPIFGMGMVLYFASQGTGNMYLQLVAGRCARFSSSGSGRYWSMPQARRCTASTPTSYGRCCAMTRRLP